MILNMSRAFFTSFVFVNASNSVCFIVCGVVVFVVFWFVKL